jgi:hypothetical protein
MRSTQILCLEDFYLFKEPYETVIGLHCHVPSKRSFETSGPAMIDRLSEQYSGAFVLPSLISITNCNSIEAALKIRSTPRFSANPLSMEWVLPFGPSVFHLGIHNLPEKSAEILKTRLVGFTHGEVECSLAELFAVLHKQREILLVLNHPFWDITEIGREQHLLVLRQFLHLHKDWIHALEYNAKRSLEENQRAIELSEQYGLPVVSGEDIHEAERGRIVNITASTSFSEFVAEIRYDKKSQLVLLENNRLF